MGWFNHHLVMFASQEGYTKIDVNKHLPETSTWHGEESELPTTNRGGYFCMINRPKKSPTPNFNFAGMSSLIPMELHMP